MRSKTPTSIFNQKKASFRYPERPKKQMIDEYKRFKEKYEEYQYEIEYKAWLKKQEKVNDVS